MGHNVIRISYTRAPFAAELLAECRSSLLAVTDLVDFEIDAARLAQRRAGVRRALTEPVDKSKLVAAALYAEWVADTLHRQIAFYTRLDAKLAMAFETDRLPDPERLPQVPPDWPQPPLPEPMQHSPNPLAGNEPKSERPTVRAQIITRMHDVVRDLDDAMRAISYAQRVRYQDEIVDATSRLRDWVTAAAAAFDGD
jgi:hypothetical protein